MRLRVHIFGCALVVIPDVVCFGFAVGCVLVMMYSWVGCFCALLVLEVCCWLLCFILSVNVILLQDSLYFFLVITLAV